MTKRAEKRMKLKKKFFSKDTTSEKIHNTSSETVVVKKRKHKNSLINSFLNFYDEKYKYLLILPIFLFIFAIAQISYQAYANDGDFINKDITLKGGVTVTVPVDHSVDIILIQETLLADGHFVNVRSLQSTGRTIGFLVESDIDINNQESLDSLLESISKIVLLKEGEYSVEGIGASIGESFFRQALVALLISFVLMALIVAITFRSFVPSIAVIASAFSDIFVTIAIIDIIGIKVSTAGLAALLMIIGYSVDTDILLATKLLKRKEGSVLERIGGAFKTGFLMNFTTFIAVLFALLITSSDIIKQIMTILLIGLIVDQISTWIQTAGILRLYLENQEKKKKEAQNES
jgi:preprotein translocase subunit SecF